VQSVQMSFGGCVLRPSRCCWVSLDLHLFRFGTAVTVDFGGLRVSWDFVGLVRQGS